MLPVSRSTITHTLASTNIRMRKALANLAIRSTSSSATDTAIISTVAPMAYCGMTRFGWMRERAEGNNLSRLIANGNREAARMPALAIEVRARPATTTAAILPGEPAMVSRRAATGALFPARTLASTERTIAIVIRV